MYKTYKSPLGYDVNDGKVDSYGVNHQNFSLRDELEYQYERQRRENKIIQGYNNQGITGNYPPQGTGFWGQNPDNNYGFGDSNIASAVETIKRNPLPAMGLNSQSLGSSDYAIIERMKPVIEKYEGNIDHPYLDTKWIKTVGDGKNIDSREAFHSVNWLNGARSATLQEKDMAFNRLQLDIDQAMQNKDIYSNLPKNNRLASSYENYSQLRLDKSEINKLRDEHLQDDIRYLHKEFPRFNSFPPELQNVLVDIKYNTGNVSQANWPNLHKAIAEKNLYGANGILNNIHRKDVGLDRNTWAEGEIKKILHWY